MSLINELKRRNVFKVAIAYVVMAWLVMQVSDVVLNHITAPGWIFHVLMLFLGIGFPFVAVEIYQQALAIDPDYAEAWAGLSVTYLSQTQSGYLEGAEGLALFSLGKGEEAHQRLARFIEENQSWGAFPIATIYAWNKDADKTFEWLNRAYERDGLMSNLLMEPLFTKLHDDPRWLEMVDKMGLPRS